MKKLLLSSLLLLGLCTISLGQVNSSSAEKFYQAGQYAQALSAYEQELKNHPNDPYLYYNIVNCYFK
ncbi:MAG: tetratricopeptide repeat protein, partial [Elusimicrobiaceae bacterium]|nr:tetratricopeptide repeat protein [Elusimicrobiaceae bacterium]